MLDGKMLDSISQGRITINIDGKPVMCLDKDSKSFELEMTGLEKINMRFPGLFVPKANRGKMLLESSQQIAKFVKSGWTFSIYDKGERLLSVGGPSKFRPQLRINPLRLRRLLKII